MIDLGTIKMPLNAATKTFAVLAKRGAGKTYTAGVMAEEMHKNGIPFVVFDPIDVWWGLRFNKDGKSEGLPIVVFGVENADVKLDRNMGARIAQSIVKHNISCVISTFGLPKVAQRQLIQEFSEELLNINNSPRHVFIEEAHEFVPQRVHGAMGKVFAAVEALVVMGRNRGIGVTLINQRAATINKDVLTQLDTLLAFRNVAPQDRKALKEWVEIHSAEDDFVEFMQSLPTLPTGEGWIWSPEFLQTFKRIKIRKRETFHPDREKLGTDFKMPELNRSDVKSFVDEFKAYVPEDITESTDTSTTTVKVTQLPPEPKIDVQAIRNEYESQLIEKDVTINGLNAKLKEIASITVTMVGSSSSPAEVNVQTSILPNNQINMILQKLGGMPRKIYETLLAHPEGLTRRQVSLMTGYSMSGSFSNAFSKLNKMSLIKKEGDVVIALMK